MWSAVPIWWVHLVGYEDWSQMFHEAQGQEMSGVPSVMGRQVRAGTSAAAPGEMVLECFIRGSVLMQEVWRGARESAVERPVLLLLLA